MTNEQLVDRVIDQIEADIEAGDVTALAELLRQIPEPLLKGFLPEDTLV